MAEHFGETAAVTHCVLPGQLFLVSLGILQRLGAWPCYALLRLRTVGSQHSC